MLSVIYVLDYNYTCTNFFIVMYNHIDLNKRHYAQLIEKTNMINRIIEIQRLTLHVLPIVNVFPIFSLLI